jgi:hypothetical protein
MNKHKVQVTSSAKMFIPSLIKAKIYEQVQKFFRRGPDRVLMKECSE